MVIMVLGILATLVCVVSYFFKKQTHFILCLCLYNFILLAQYLWQQCYLEVGVIIVDIIKSLLFYWHARKNCRPQLWLIIWIEITLVIIGVLLWQNWYSIFMLLSSLIMAWAVWQKDMLFMKICCLIASGLLILNYYFTGLYTTIIGESVALVAVSISIFTYRRPTPTPTLSPVNHPAG